MNQVILVDPKLFSQVFQKQLLMKLFRDNQLEDIANFHSENSMVLL